MHMFRPVLTAVFRCVNTKTIQKDTLQMQGAPWYSLYFLMFKRKIYNSKDLRNFKKCTYEDLLLD